MLKKEQEPPIIEPKYPPGARVSWRAANGPKSGVTAGFRNGNYLVLLDNGRHVIVNEKSIAG